VRTISLQNVVDAVESLCIAAAYELPDDVLAAIKSAIPKESNPTAAHILGQLLENAEIAAHERIPLCQDTGITVVFAEQGANVIIVDEQDNSIALSDAVNKGIASGYERGYLRKSIVAEPLNERVNTGTNAPAVLHHRIVPGEQLGLTVMLKGGGCENKSQFHMFKPTAEKEEVIDWIVNVVRSAGADACPPFVVGVGIGGDFELSCMLSKRALLRPLDSNNDDAFYAGLEDELLQRVNSLGVGPQGLGGDTTALGVSIETAPCHIASLPVAVNIECHSHRHKTAVL